MRNIWQGQVGFVWSPYIRGDKGRALEASFGVGEFFARLVEGLEVSLTIGNEATIKSFAAGGNF